MRSAFICLTLAIVVSTVFSQRPIVRYSENLKKAVPHHYNHDQKNTDRSLDKIARGHKIEPPLPPLRPHSEVPWLRWVQEGRWAAQADKNSELHKVRARLLEEKLKPNNFAFRPQINPQLKPKLKRKENVRHKREAMMPQVPEVNMQPDNEVKLSQPHEQMQRKTEGLEKRDKRQILYFINKPPKLLARSPRTTPNPFIRDTHIEDYDIIRPEVGEREGMIPTIEAGSSDLGSYPLVNEEVTDYTKIITQLYLTTSVEYWNEIQWFSENILKPIFELKMKKRELFKALESLVEITRISEVRNNPRNNISVKDRQESSYLIATKEYIYKRVKRRVNKTLQRKQAKKKKQRLRRFERKRLRMLTHARRVRRQQKSKQARLQRHYARMNMSTTAIPEHLRNQTLISYDEDQDVGEERSKDKAEDEEGAAEENDDYESSEYEDESEYSETETKDKSKIKSNKDSSDDESESGISEIGSKPDYGNDDYEYEEDSDDDYEDDDTSEEESERKKKKSGKEKKAKTAMKSRREHPLKMISRKTH